MKMIKEYTQKTGFVNAGAGTSTWCIASKNGKKYFIKSFLEVTLIDEETAQNLPAPMVEAKRKSCVQFRIRKERLYNKLNEIQNGVFVSPIELLVHNGHFCAVTDYLESFDDSDNIYRLTARRKTVLMRTMVLAMRDLAENHIVHSDIKPDNIVITYNQKKMPQLKIIDFDSGFFEDAPPHNVNEYHGDMAYFAPESMVFLQSEGESDVRLTCAIDKFAVGLLLHKMWCGMLPTYDTNECVNVAEALLLDKPVTLHNSIPAKISEVITGFLREDPDTRMNYDQAYDLLGAYLSELPEEHEESKSPVSSPKEEVRVRYVDTEGHVLDNVALTPESGSSTLTVYPRKISGYKCLDNKYDVRIDPAGHAKPSEVTFKYEKKKHKVWLWVLVALFGAALLWWVITAASANTAIDNRNWGTALRYSELCPFYDGVYPQKNACIHYNYGVQLYRAGQYYAARNEFDQVTGYYNCGKWKTLCKAHSNGANMYVEALMEIIEFEDAKDLILSNDESFEQFMAGTWSVTSGNTAYSDYELYQQDDGWWMRALPDSPGSGNWDYEPGYIQYKSSGSSNGYYNLHAVKITDKNHVTFTNCKTSKDYKLTRK